MRKYLTVEFPDNPVVVDFLGKYPCTATLIMDDKGELWVQVVSATQEARILVDEVVSVPEGDGDEN